jgi:hypothetical protein
MVAVCVWGVMSAPRAEVGTSGRAKAMAADRRWELGDDAWQSGACQYPPERMPK